MRIYGTLKEVVALWLKGTGNGRNAKITVTASPSTDNVEYQLPDNSTNDVLVTNASSSILTNKTFNADGTGNSITNIENADIKAGAAIDATKIGAGSVDNTEFGYLNGVTSAIQTQLGNKAASGANSDITSLSGLTTALSIGQGGSGQTTANTALNAFLPSQTSAANKYLKSDGSNTSWASASGGAGEINAILNASGADGTTGWIGTSVVSGSSSPLNPIVTTAFSIANTATSESSTSGGYCPFPMPSGLLNRKLKVELTFTTPATDVYRVSVYQGSTRVALSTDSSSVTTLPASVTGGKFTAYFDADSNTSWTLSVTRTSGSTGACIITNVIIGPGIQPQGAVVGEWTVTTASITSSGGGSVSTGTGGTPSSAMSYRRVGDSMECILSWRFGTSSPSFGTGTTYRIQLPLGLNYNASAILTANIANVVGVGKLLDNSTATFYDVNVSASNTNQTYVFLSPLDGTNIDIGPTSPFTFAADDQITLKFTVPIAEWAGSGTVNLAQNDVEYAYNTDVSSTATVTGSGYGYGPGGVNLPSSNWTVGTNWARRVLFQTPVQATDIVVLEVLPSGAQGWVPINTAIGGYINTSSTYSYGAAFATVSGVPNAIDVSFTNGGAVPSGTFGTATGVAWTVFSSYKWRVRKSSAGAAVGFGIADTNSSGLVPSGTYNKSTGAWTLGNTGSTTTHIANGAQLRVDDTSTVNGSSTLNLQALDGSSVARTGSITMDAASNSNQGLYFTAPVGKLWFYNGAVNSGQVSTGGAWTFGPTSGATGSSHFMYTDRGADNALVVQNTTTSSTPYGLLLQFPNSTANDTTSTFLVCSANADQRLLIYNNGNVVNDNNSYGTLSDARYKQDITEATSQIEDIKAIQFKKYRFIKNVEADPNAAYHLGVIAQELSQTSPGLVDYDETNDRYTVKSSIMYMKAVKALQETIALVEDLRTELDDAKARIATLEGNS